MRLKTKHVHIQASGRSMKLIVLRPERADHALPGILWIHGGGYMTGMPGMVHASRGKDLAKRFGAVVVSPGYRLAWQAPYPAALEDCYAALQWLWRNAEALGVDRDRIVVGGESAGGGLAAAVCLCARDRGQIPVAMQLPLYPMLDCRDTASSRDNHGKIWNTRRNHWGWRHYLGPLYHSPEVPAWASPARAADLTGLPPCYTYVCDGEPFYQETVDYCAALQAAGIPARADVFHGNVHAFDMFLFWSDQVKQAKQELARAFARELGLEARPRAELPQAQSAEALWQASGLTGTYEAWSFGGDPDTLADLTARGIKTATCSGAVFYELENEPLPRVGEYSVILDGTDRARCIIRTTRVWRCPFDRVGERHAWMEGEGDRSLSHWRQVHEAFFAQALAEIGRPFDPTMELICEEFRVVYPQQ